MARAVLSFVPSGLRQAVFSVAAELFRRRGLNSLGPICPGGHHNGRHAFPLCSHWTIERAGRLILRLSKGAADTVSEEAKLNHLLTELTLGSQLLREMKQLVRDKVVSELLKSL